MPQGGGGGAGGPPVTGACRPAGGAGGDGAPFSRWGPGAGGGGVGGDFPCCWTCKPAGTSIYRIRSLKTKMRGNEYEPCIVFWIDSSSCIRCSSRACFSLACRSFSLIVFFHVPSWASCSFCIRSRSRTRSSNRRSSAALSVIHFASTSWTRSLAYNNDFH